jgi:hypothetical protein
MPTQIEQGTDRQGPNSRRLPGRLGRCGRSGRPFLLGGLAALAVSLQLALAASAAAATLTVDRSSFMIGESTVYQITGAAANSAILWSSWKNGVSTGEVNVNYGQVTDAHGNWNALAGAWPAGDVGSWTKQATIGGLELSVSFTVVERLTLDRAVYAVGQAPTYTIKAGPPNTAILWSSTLNGVSTGEVNVNYGQVTDANGNWSAAGGAWSAANVGTWTKTASIGGLTATVGFQVRSDALSQYLQSVGVYDSRGTGSLASGASMVTGLGGRALKVQLVPNCSQPQTLLQMASSADARAAFANPGIQVFSISAFDVNSLCASGRIYVDPTLYVNSNGTLTAFSAATSAEFENLALYLYRTYHDSGKTFYISNWEGDNAVYCSDAYGYATNAATRSSCNSSYPTSYDGVPNPDTGMQGLQDWLNARQSGIAAARSQAASEGIASVTVYHTPEINIVRALQAAGLESVLYNVLPNVHPDAVSYSSYESINTCTTEPIATCTATLSQDLSTIAAKAGTSRIILGEIGFSEAQFSNTSIQQWLGALLPAALTDGVAATFEWVLIDNDQFGLYNTSNQIQPTGTYYQTQYADHQ